MKAMNMIRAAVFVGILGASPASAGISTASGTRDDAYPIRNQMVYGEERTRDDAYPIRNQMVYDEERTRDDAYPIRKQKVYGEEGTRDAYPIRNQMVYDEENTASQSWLRRWLGPHSPFFVRLITYIG